MILIGDQFGWDIAWVLDFRAMVPSGHRDLAFQWESFALKKAEALTHPARSKKLRHVGTSTKCLSPMKIMGMWDT